MIAVLDASAAIEIVLKRNSAENLSQYIVDADWLITPTLFIAEVTNVFWKYQKMADISFLSCEKGIEQALSFPDDFINELDLYREAFKLGCTMNHPIYDMLYLVVARRNDAVLLTMDKKLIKAADRCFIDVCRFD